MSDQPSTARASFAPAPRIAAAYGSARASKLECGETNADRDGGRRQNRSAAIFTLERNMDFKTPCTRIPTDAETVPAVNVRAATCIAIRAV